MLTYHVEQPQAPPNAPEADAVLDVRCPSRRLNLSFFLTCVGIYLFVEASSFPPLDRRS